MFYGSVVKECFIFKMCLRAATRIRGSSNEKRSTFKVIHDNLQYNMKNADTGKVNRENGSTAREGL
jgi:hypothetical protein